MADHHLLTLLSRVSMRDDNGPAPKRRRLCTMGVERLPLWSSTPAPPLPADLWAKAVEFLPLDEVLSVSCLNRFFLQEVSPLLSQLHVAKSSNVTAGPALRRFVRVHRLEIPCFLSLTRLEETAPQRLIRFLQCFPLLSHVDLGPYNQGFPSAGLIQLKKMKVLISHLCQAYAGGHIPSNLRVDGLLPTLRRQLFCCLEFPCVCSLICQTFPPQQILELSNPWCCVPSTLRLNLATIDRVAPVSFPQTYWNSLLIQKIQSYENYFPQDQMVDHNDQGAIQYHPSTTDYVDWLIHRQGADPKQPQLRILVLGSHPADAAAGGIPRRKVTRSAWKKFQEWKLAVAEWELELVDDTAPLSSNNTAEPTMREDIM